MKRSLILALIIAIIGFGILIWFVIELIPSHLNINYDLSLEKSSKIGDFVGGFVGALFTIAGFILLYETFNLQRIESANTKTFLKIQQFENNYFQLIKSNNDVVSSMDISQEEFNNKGDLIDRKVFFTGKDCFGFWFKELKKMMNHDLSMLPNLKQAFLKFYTEWELDLSVYYSQIKQLLRFVEYSNIQNDNIYIDIFKANLSVNELVIMYYFTYLNSDNEFKRLTEKYKIFDNLVETHLINIDHINLSKIENV